MNELSIHAHYILFWVLGALFGSSLTVALHSWKKLFGEKPKPCKYEGWDD